MERSKKIIVFGAAVVIALLAVTFFMADNLTSTTDAAGGGPEMILTVPGGACADGECNLDEGAAFKLAVEIVTAPPEGYILAQSWVDFGSELVYKPADSQADEVLWPDCVDVTVVGSMWTADAPPDQTTEVSEAVALSTGCLSGLIAPEPSSYLGEFLTLSFNCTAAPSTTLVKLLPEGDEIAGTSGTLFSIPPDGIQVVPKVSNLTINCGEVGGGDPTDTPEDVATDTPEGPTDTPAPVTDTPVPPTSTPVPPTSTPSPQLCGDVSGDGNVNSIDAAIILQLTAGLISDVDRLEKPDLADVNGDGEVTSVDAALVLQKEAGRIDQDRLTC